MSGSIGKSWAASQLPTRPIPVTISSKQTRKPYRSRRSASPSQKRAGGEYPGKAAALTGSQKKADTLSGPACFNSSSSWASAASPLGSKRGVAGARWKYSGM